MRVQRRRLIRWAGVATALPALAAFRAQAQTGDRPTVLVGQSVPLTGPASEIGLAYAAGAKLYVDAFNQRPDSPVRVELRQLDDGYVAARAGANARRLLQDGAVALFGFAGAASALAAATVAQQQGAVLVAPFAAPDSLRGPAHPNVFMVRPGMADEAFKMVQHASTIGLARIAVVGDDDALGRAGLEAVQRAAQELKLPPLVATALIPAQSSEVDAAVAAVQAAQPQAIIQAALFQNTAAFIQKMRKAGYAGSFMSFSSVGIAPLFFALDKQIRGVVVSQVVPSPGNRAVPVVREYLATLEQSDQTAGYESLEGFIAAKALCEGLRRAGRGANGAMLARALSGMPNYDVGGFRLNLRAGPREATSAIELVSIGADGRIIR
ncbi:ABC transporter substrate-binding protein [Xenophilus arseniciresistens]|uniref:ABC transporter substrate-binding protein n=1 Tax=Xenophilus arseniciresistens TaxID=1283306 RepID=A0AAE3NCB6_9BURK|nr:ABC transporter substrate-binding protein [Xenophilus arseniciresistens]MDA7418211.1 ABC transporter substrate-binding protein [Xenophilus arseniciresistens]